MAIIIRDQRPEPIRNFEERCSLESASLVLATDRHCQLCGHTFYAGDYMRAVYGNDQGIGNWFVCRSCDNPDTQLLIERYRTLRQIDIRIRQGWRNPANEVAHG